MNNISLYTHTYIYKTHLYPFICWGAFGLFLHPCCCDCCCSRHGSAGSSLTCSGFKQHRCTVLECQWSGAWLRISPGQDQSKVGGMENLGPLPSTLSAAGRIRFLFILSRWSPLSSSQQHKMNPPPACNLFIGFKGSCDYLGLGPPG